MAQQRARGGSQPGEGAVATFDTLVQEEQSLKERMQARLTEITPAVEEAAKIKAWLTEHTSDNGAQASAPAPGGQSRRQSTSQRRQTTGTRRGAVREQFLSVVRRHPDGITVADVAKELGKSPAYFYRIAGNLKGDGVIADAPNGQGVIAV